MTKSELKTGMILTDCQGHKFMVFKDAIYGHDNNPEDVLVGINPGTSWNELSKYREDLTNIRYNDLDIIKVEKCSFVTDLTRDDRRPITIWERKKKKTYTYAQLKEILGTEFEIVG